MVKIDYKKEFGGYKAKKNQVAIIEIPKMSFLMIDGDKGPGNPDFQLAVEALFGLSYTLKFMIKKGPQAIDYGVMPLEGLWWSDDMESFIAGEKSKWKWTAMIMQPLLVTDDLMQEARALFQKKKGTRLLDNMRFESFDEGMCAQVLHIGPFENEGPVIQQMHKEIEKVGRLRDKHHEIYLSDIRRAAPEKWKTILRQPVTLNT